MGPSFPKLFIESSHLVPIELQSSHSTLDSNVLSEKWNTGLKVVLLRPTILHWTLSVLLSYVGHHRPTELI